MLDTGTMFVPPVKVDQPIDIVIPCHERLELTITCVKAIYQNTQAPFNLIVVDDSTDKITPLYWEEMQKRLNNITYIYSETPFKEGNQYLNLAFKHTTSPYIACIGNSVRVEPEWEVVALDIFKQQPDVGIIGFKNLFGLQGAGCTEGSIESAGISMMNYTPVDIGRDLPSHRLSSIYEPLAVQWAFAMVRKQAVMDDGVGNLPEGVYNGFKGWDDIDNCFVLRAEGWKVIYCGLGAGYHYPRATRGSNTRLSSDLNRENARKFYRRWGYWDMFIKDYPKAPDGTDWPEAETIQAYQPRRRVNEQATNPPSIKKRNRRSK